MLLLCLIIFDIGHPIIVNVMFLGYLEIDKQYFYFFFVALFSVYPLKNSHFNMGGASGGTPELVRC